MQRDEIIEALRQHRESFEKEGATALFLYGSRARGDHRPDSDLDLFVDYDSAGKFSLLNLAGIKLLAEEAIGLDAHVTTRDSLNPRVQERIEDQAVKVF